MPRNQHIDPEAELLDMDEDTLDTINELIAEGFSVEKIFEHLEEEEEVSKECIKLI